MNMAPLKWPDSIILPPPPPAVAPPDTRSWLQKLWDLIPRPISYGPEYCRAANYIEEQLAARERPDPSRWGDDPLRAKVGQRVCKLIKEEFDLPNDHFLPDDPLDVLLLRPWDYDMLIDKMALGLYAEFDISEEDATKFIWTAKTLGEMVDMLIAHLQRRSASGGRRLDH